MNNPVYALFGEIIPACKSWEKSVISTKEGLRKLPDNFMRSGFFKSHEKKYDGKQKAK